MHIDLGLPACHTLWTSSVQVSIQERIRWEEGGSALACRYFVVASYYVACTSRQCLLQQVMAAAPAARESNRIEIEFRTTYYVVPRTCSRHSTHFTFCPFKPLTYSSHPHAQCLLGLTWHNFDATSHRHLIRNFCMFNPIRNFRETAACFGPRALAWQNLMTRYANVAGQILTY